MAGTPSVFMKCQLGAETVPGTLVGAGKRPLTFDLKPKPETRVQPYRPVGSLAAVTQSQGKEHTSFEVEGALGFVDIAYVLASLLKKQAGGSPFTILPLTFGPEEFQTYTIEHGPPTASRAQRFGYAVFTGLSISADETELSMTARGFGRKLEKGMTLTNSPTNLAKAIASAKDAVIKIGNSVGSLAALPKNTQAEWSIEDRWKPRFYQNTDASFTEIVAGTPNLSASLSMDNDSTADDLLADLRSGQIKIVEIGNVGPEYSAGNNYEFRLRFPAILNEQEMADDDDAYIATFPLTPCYDETFGGWCEFYVNNGLGSL